MRESVPVSWIRSAFLCGGLRPGFNSGSYQNDEADRLFLHCFSLAKVIGVVMTKSSSSLVLFVVVLSIVLCFSVTCAASSRVALVIGNGNYQSSPLKNPVNDANDIATLLSSLDFEVIKLIDADRREMVTAINEFSSKLRRSEVGLFYFAGHGMQINDTNFLLPIGINVVDESDVEFEAVRADRVIAKMRSAETRLNVVILDACRDNPLRRTFRSSARGLARMDAPKGTIIAYATSPGSTAADGQGRNGVYTGHLLDVMAVPGLDIQDMFNEAGMKVMEDTDDAQVPWTSITPIPKYYLAGTAPDSGGSAGFVQQPIVGALKVESNPAGADVAISGQMVGQTPLFLDNIPSGTIQLSISKEGYISQDRQVKIKPGRRVILNLILTSEKKTGWLTIQAIPQHATVRFLNSNKIYQPDMELETGKYLVEVSAPGYQAQQQWVEISSGDDLNLAIRLQQAQQAFTKGWLTVLVTPEDAKVRILNIKEKYQPDIELPQGRYHLEVSAPGYKTDKQWVEIAGGDDLILNVTLRKLPYKSKIKVTVKEQEPPQKRSNHVEQGEVSASANGPEGPVYKDAMTGMEFVYVPEGCYQMGDIFNEGEDNEKPVHKVCVNGFYMGKYEVTQGEYQQITGLNPSRFRGSSRLPVERVAWDNILQFIDGLNKRSAKRYRLPTEAEWEYAAREGGRKVRFGFGKDQISGEDANYNSMRNQTVEVGSYKPNGLGLHDMSGNVWEYCSDMHSSIYYHSSPQQNPKHTKSLGPWDPLYQVIRGGGYNSSAESLRATKRDKYQAREQFEYFIGNASSHLGFRLVFPAE